MRRLLLIGAAILTGVAAVGYFVGGFIGYYFLANVKGSCDRHLANRPDHFVPLSADPWPLKDYSRYYFSNYDLVRFPSRDAQIEIAGWYAEAVPDAPVIIVVEGFGGCKHSIAALLPAGILYHNGFNVLVIDLRDTGDSGWEDGYAAAGTDEYADILGAWDWLRHEKKYDAARIGLFGSSMGGTAALLAFMQESEVAAVAANSPFADPTQVVRDYLTSYGAPGFLAPVPISMSRLINGDRVTDISALQAMAAAGDHPVFVLHSWADSAVRLDHSLRLRAVAQAHGINASFWFVDGAEHVQIPAVYTEEFERRITDFSATALGK